MANKFVFSTTRNILCEVGAAKAIGNLFKGLGCGHGQTILFVTDKGIHDAKLADKAVANVRQCGFNVEVYHGVVADPPESKILEAVDMSKRNSVVGVVGFGGGSSMDVAKLVAFLGHKGCTQNMQDIYGVGMCQGNRLPLVQIPTTAGTGSEVTPISIITTGAKEKKGVVSSVLLPDWAVLDGELTLSVPPHVSAATGIDAMVHAIEAYTTKLKKNSLSDLLAKEALRLLGGNIRRVCSTDGSRDADARGAMLLGSMYAGMAFANAPVGAVHALAYPIGSHFHVPHGLSNSLVLPHVIRFNAAPDVASTASCAAMYADLADITFQGDLSSTRDVFEKSEEFASLFEKLAAELTIAGKLREVGIEENDITLLAREAMNQTRLLPNNARDMCHEDALEIYRKAF